MSDCKYYTNLKAEYNFLEERVEELESQVEELECQVNSLECEVLDYEKRHSQEPLYKIKDWLYTYDRNESLGLELPTLQDLRRIVYG